MPVLGSGGGGGGGGGSGSFTFAGQWGPADALSILGVPLPNTLFTVFNIDGVTEASLFTDRTMSVAGPNPFNADDLGNVTFFASPGNYLLRGNGVELGVLVCTDPSDVGGVIGNAAFEAAVRLSDPSQLAAMRGNLVGGGFRGTNFGTGQVLGDLATMQQSNGWVIDSSSWTFISQWQFSTPGLGGVFIYPKGTAVTWKEASVAKYGVVQGSTFNGTNTIVNLIPTSDYLMTVNPDPTTQSYCFGHPSGFPTNFTYPGSTTTASSTINGSAAVTITANPNIRVGMEVSDGGVHIPAGVTVAAVNGASLTLSTGSGVTNGFPTLTFNIFTGFSTAPAVASNWWSVQGGICTVNLATFGTGTSNATAMNVLLPIAALGGNRTAVPAVVTDAGTSQIGMLTISASATTGGFNVGTVTGFTATGNKGASVQVAYPI